MSENSAGRSSAQHLSLSTAQEEIVEKKGQKSSAAWRYFGYLKSDKQQSNVLCKMCRSHVPTKTGNTSNLFQHLKRHHPLEHAECCQVAKAPSTSNKRKADQQTIQSALSSTMAYEKSSKRHKDITHAITQFIAKGMQPVCTVETAEFNNRSTLVINSQAASTSRRQQSQICMRSAERWLKGTCKPWLTSLPHRTCGQVERPNLT